MHPQRRLSHAQGYLELGMLAEAAAELDRISGPVADTVAVLAVRLSLLHERRDWSAVRTLAQDLARRVPEDAAIWVTWAYATRRAEGLLAAEKILLNAEQLHPAEATIQFNLGCYACQRGDLAVARQRVDQAIALDAKFTELARTDEDLAPLRAAEDSPDCQSGS